MSGDDGTVTPPPDPPRRRAVRGSVAVLVLTLVIAILGAGYLWSGANTTMVYVATRDLPAYHQIGELDVRRVPVRGRLGASDAVIQHLDSVLGRYTLRSMRHDDTFRTDMLGPLLRRGALADLLVLTVTGRTESTLGGAAARGDRVDLVLAPRGQSNRRYSIVRDVLLIDTRGTVGYGKSSVSFGVTSEQEEVFASVAGEAELFVVRRAPYSRP